MPTVAYLIREGIRGLIHAKAVTFVSIVTVAVALFIADVTAVGVINIWTLFEKTADRADVVVYVKDDALADTAALRRLIRSFPQVATTALVDKEAARERFTSIYGADMLEAVEENPLPVSIEVILRKEHQTAEAAAALKEALQDALGVDAVRYAREWIDLAEQGRHYLIIAALILAALVVATLYITIINSVKLTMFGRRELMHTLQMLGATRFFVGMPFVVEGMLQGFAGGILAVAGFFALQASLHHLPLVFGPLYLQGAMVLLGIFFGWLGGIAAVRKFLI